MAVLSLGAAWIGTRDSVLHMITVKPFRPSTASDLASLRGATDWLNSPPLTAAALQGKVVLIDFWTYTCINWLRTVPYVRAWAARYSEQGLVVIGVHTPEFTFEENIDNVRKAAQERGVTNPIGIDNNRAIWSGFGNHYWPALYFIDATGRVRDHHFGEGNYEESEARIRQLLAAPRSGPVMDSASVSIEAHGPEVGADWGSLKSPETYVDHSKAEMFASPGGAVVKHTSPLWASPRLRLNQWALSGEWSVQAEAAVLNAAGGRVAYRFHRVISTSSWGHRNAAEPFIFECSSTDSRRARTMEVT
jgi:thiol-disulfide isomerase/thioredoxin